MAKSLDLGGGALRAEITKALKDGPKTMLELRDSIFGPTKEPNEGYAKIVYNCKQLKAAKKIKPVDKNNRLSALALNENPPQPHVGDLPNAEPPAKRKYTRRSESANGRVSKDVQVSGNAVLIQYAVKRIKSEIAALEEMLAR